MDEIIAIDIGSTRTKGALFRVSNEKLQLITREEGETTTGDLSDGFFQILEALGNRSRNTPTLAYSSSAKGGLSICAVGIVPDLTLKMAKQTALSAGGKVSSYFAWKLTDGDLESIQAENPDIILFTGGTDGGNEEYLFHNASQLARLIKLGWEGPILFAGNRSAADQVRKLLRGRELYICENILPEIDRPNPEPARQEIRRIFLQRLCGGKGLEWIIKKTGEAPLPTPSVIFDFLSHPAFRDGTLFSKGVADGGVVGDGTKADRKAAVGEAAGASGGSGLLLFDIGGATSDCYSFGVPAGACSRRLRGLAEPDPKRTVEGDLGLRVSASSAVAAAEAEGFYPGGSEIEALRDYADQVSRRAETPPGEIDRFLAEICLTLTLLRHAGEVRDVATPSGTVQVQMGKDLSGIRAIIGTGGFLSRSAEAVALPSPPLFNREGWELLIPKNPQFLQDQDYLWPLLANAARIQPEAALRLAPEVLVNRNYR